MIQDMFDSSMKVLSEKYPNIFSLERFTYSLFQFAHHAVMSRAFGKRLPYSAMVPFADCLNHSNVQTKYDCNVNGNGLFRMFPSGVNRYECGQEIFNSDGRRKNDNLLMEYGFAMIDNEWDTVFIFIYIYLYIYIFIYIYFNN
jgi:hypothetical protein